MSKTYPVFATTSSEEASIQWVLRLVDKVAQNTVLSVLAEAALTEELNYG